MKIQVTRPVMEYESNHPRILWFFIPAKLRIIIKRCSFYIGEKRGPEIRPVFSNILVIIPKFKGAKMEEEKC